MVSVPASSDSGAGPPGPFPSAASAPNAYPNRTRRGKVPPAEHPSNIAHRAQHRHDRRKARLTLLLSSSSLSLPSHQRIPNSSSLPTTSCSVSCSCCVVARRGWFQHLVSPSCCISSTSRFLHRDKGSPRPPPRRKGAARILRDDD